MSICFSNIHHKNEFKGEHLIFFNILFTGSMRLVTSGLFRITAFYFNHNWWDSNTDTVNSTLTNIYAVLHSYHMYDFNIQAKESDEEDVTMQRERNELQGCSI